MHLCRKIPVVRAAASATATVTTLLLLVSTILPEGILADDFPVQAGTMNELVVFTVTNVARANFPYYRDAIASKAGAKSGCATTMPSQQPFEWSNALQSTAIDHTTDMVRNRCFSHDSCRCVGAACSFGNRMKTRYGNAYSAENIAEGALTTDMATLVDRWMESRSHCVNIMGDKFRQIGISVQDKSTQDFGSLGGGGAPVNKLLSGVHVKGRFLAVMAAGSDAVPAVVIGGSTAYPMQAVGNGVYQSIQVIGACTNYYFQNGGQRFPTTGSLVANCGNTMYFAADTEGQAAPLTATAPSIVAMPAMPVPAPAPRQIQPAAQRMIRPAVLPVVNVRPVTFPMPRLLNVVAQPQPQQQQLPTVKLEDFKPFVRSLLASVVNGTAVPVVITAPAMAISNATTPAVYNQTAPAESTATNDATATATVLISASPVVPANVNPVLQSGRSSTQYPTEPATAYDALNAAEETHRVGTKVASIGVPSLMVCGIAVAGLLLRRRRNNKRAQESESAAPAPASPSTRSPSDSDDREEDVELGPVETVPPPLRFGRSAAYSVEPPYPEVQAFPEESYGDDSSSYQQQRRQGEDSIYEEYGRNVGFEEHERSVYQPRYTYRTSVESMESFRTKATRF